MFNLLFCGGCNHQLHPHDVDYVDDFTGESFCSNCMIGGMAHARVTQPLPIVTSKPKLSVADIVLGGGSNLVVPAKGVSEIAVY